MNYKLFKELVLNTFASFLPKEYAKCPVRETSITKANKTLEAFYVDLPQQEKTKSVPILYFEDLYSRYKNTGELAETVKKAAEKYVEALKSSPQVDMNDLKNAKVILCLVNAKANAELLKSVPYRYFLDLAVIYRLDLGNGKTALVTNKHLSFLNMTEEELFRHKVSLYRL